MGSAPRRSSGSERTRHSSDVYRVSKKSVVMGFLGVQCGISKLAGSQVGETADIVRGRRQHSTVQRAYPCPSIPGTGRSPSFPRRGSKSRKVLPTSSCRCVEVRGGAWRCQGNMELQGDLPTVAILTTLVGRPACESLSEVATSKVRTSPKRRAHTQSARSAALPRRPSASRLVIDEITSATFLEIASPLPRGKLALTDCSAGPHVALGPPALRSASPSAVESRAPAPATAPRSSGSSSGGSTGSDGSTGSATGGAPGWGGG